MISMVCGVPPTFLTEEDLALEGSPDWIPCCAGSAWRGPGGCTCWNPVYDIRAQRRARVEVAPATRDTMCGDCAFKANSPEREDGKDLEGLPNFWCHQGMRRIVAYRHPDGRVRECGPGDYKPPIIDGVAYRANGLPADRCGGHAKLARAR